MGLSPLIITTLNLYAGRGKPDSRLAVKAAAIIVFLASIIQGVVFIIALSVFFGNVVKHGFVSSQSKLKREEPVRRLPLLINKSRPRPHFTGGIRRWLGLPSTLISQEHGAFRIKTLFKAEKFENAWFAFLCGRKRFLKRWRYDNHRYASGLLKNKCKITVFTTILQNAK